VSTTEELLGRKSSGSDLENREYGPGNPSRWLRGSLYPQKLTLTSPTSFSRSIGIVRSRTQATKQSNYYFASIRQHIKSRRNAISRKDGILYSVVVGYWDPLCGLVVRVLGYRSGGPGSIPRTTKKKGSGSGTGFTQPHEYNWGATWEKNSGSCLENRELGRRDPSRWPRGTLYPQKLAITSTTSGGLSVGIVLSRTQAMEFSFSGGLDVCAGPQTEACSHLMHTVVGTSILIAYLACVSSRTSFHHEVVFQLVQRD
jgi:hypothetical protein